MKSLNSYEFFGTESLLGWMYPPLDEYTHIWMNVPTVGWINTHSATYSASAPPPSSPHNTHMIRINALLPRSEPSSVAPTQLSASAIHSQSRSHAPRRHSIIFYCYSRQARFCDFRRHLQCVFRGIFSQSPGSHIRHHFRHIPTFHKASHCASCPPVDSILASANDLGFFQCKF